jgi:hypothetical protein
MQRLGRLRVATPAVVLIVVVLASGSLVAGDSPLGPGGTFFDDDGNIHEGNIEAIAAAGITRSCNPPHNTKYCPNSPVTRGQMAAFLHRALDIPTSGVDAFGDDDGSIFEADINAIAAVGITRGCNPPDNDRFCPDATVTREQMAAFLRRALALSPSAVDAFGDDDGSIFEADINAIAAEGITRGCNPPDNDRYCPTQQVLRDQMASFLSRALGLSPIYPPQSAGFVSPIAAFADYNDVALLTNAVPYAGPNTPDSLGGIALSDWVAQQLARPGVAQHIADYGFVVVPDGYRLFHWIYDIAAYEWHPVFVTTDAAYNMWHLVFDKILRDTETNVLLPKLESLVQDMLAAARSQTAALSATPLADHALRVEEWLEAAATLLELDVGPIGPRAQEEVDLIMAHAAVAESPTMGIDECIPVTDSGTCVSYATFKPRGHYTRSAELQRFFRAMSMLGQTPLPTTKPEEMRLAALLIGLLVQDSEIESSWQLIYDPTAFLVGLADDYTPYEFRDAVAATVTSGFTDPAAFADDSNLAAIADKLHALRPIAIDPERPSVRFMGSRATLDAYIMDQLIDPAVPGRGDLSALDVAAAFGSDWALDLQSDQITEHEAYLPQMTRLRRSVTARSSANWAATVYDAWLHAIAVMWADHGVAYPDFMRTEAWAAKAHQTGFGSYAELKHDTILYVKPSFAEGGGGLPDVPPRHWVEPEPVAFQRLAAAAELMGDGLAVRGLLPLEYAELIDDAVNILDRLARLAEDELAGRPISAADNDWLGGIGPELEGMWLRTADLDEHGMPTDIDEEAAIVADIAETWLNGALEIATGRIDPMLVLVPNDQGDFQVAVGGVYSYYEFWQDPSNRLTDEEWRAWLRDGLEPSRPAWQQVLFPAD